MQKPASSARMVSMKNATDNAEGLTTPEVAYNKLARQYYEGVVGNRRWPPADRSSFGNQD
jgi:hypothetical protein